MTLHIEYESQSFPPEYSPGTGRLTTTWGELLWAALTIGRPSTYHVFRHGSASFHEAIFRLALVRMAVEQDGRGFLRRTDAYVALDPTEKGMVSYFLGMALCKLFAWRRLQTPWLLHLDVFRHHLNPIILGRSRPDLVGEDIFKKWHAFESKGRSSAPSAADKTRAKTQAQRLVSIGTTSCSLHVGTFAYFGNDILEFFWCDPEPASQEGIKLPSPKGEWRYYFEPSLRLARAIDSAEAAADRRLADVQVEIHPDVLSLLQKEEWLKAKLQAQEIFKTLTLDGYQPDGIKVMPGDSWAKRFEPSDRG
jgi:hypothetical protein